MSGISLREALSSVRAIGWCLPTTARCINPAVGLMGVTNSLYNFLGNIKSQWGIQPSVPRLGPRAGALTLDRTVPYAKIRVSG
jgi:hypothetical protein